MKYQPDHYYLHDEMTRWLVELTDAHPAFAALESIGQSPEGRDIWLVTLTDLTTGAPEDKPAYWIDANTHASEVTGNAAALYTINWVLHNLEDPAVAQLLETRTLYVLPRLNPDGAEYCLTHQHYVRSARRLYPDPEPSPGLLEQDIDGDGFVLQMRVEAPDGAWRRCDRDARLMVARMPWDGEGPFYHLYAEGLFEDETLADPRMPVMSRDPHGLDFNRNYPWQWKPEHDQIGAGPYPLSEPETRAVVDFLLGHQNICGIMSYHTYTGVLLRPYGDRPDTEMPPFDLQTFELIGKRCEELTGYPCVSVFHDFAYDPTKAIGGVFDDWAYEQFGVHAYTMELWDPQNKAGVEKKEKLLEHWMKPTEDDLLKYLAWNDDALDGEGFVDWHEFEHPQIGRVEIGGWKFMFTLRNPPTQYLEEICATSCAFTLDHARCVPLPTVSLTSELVDGDVHRITATLRNDGFLPTYVTMHAKSKNLVKPLHLDFEAEGLELVDGKRHERVPHLDGLANHSMPPYPAHTHHGQTRGHIMQRHWLVRGHGVAKVTWRGDRIGRTETTLEV